MLFETGVLLPTPKSPMLLRIGLSVEVAILLLGLVELIVLSLLKVGVDIRFSLLRLMIAEEALLDFF